MPVVCHLYTWAIMLVLFLTIVFIPFRANWLVMILRISYLSVIISGGILFFNVVGISPVFAIVKTVISLIVLGLMEIIIVAKNRNGNINLLALLFIIFLGSAIYLGYYNF